MRDPHTDESNARRSCGCASACGTESIVMVQSKPEPDSIPVFRISTMDCAAEEGEIRHALANLPGLRSLSFKLGAGHLPSTLPPNPSKALDAIHRRTSNRFHCQNRQGTTTIMTKPATTTPRPRPRPWPQPRRICASEACPDTPLPWSWPLAPNRFLSLHRIR